MSTLTYRKILDKEAEGTSYDISFQISGEDRPEAGIAKAHPYSWEFALQASKHFPNVVHALVRLYFPSRFVSIAEYQPQTTQKEKIAEISANLLPQLTVSIPVFKSPPVTATDQIDGNNHLVEWLFKHVKVDRKFRCLLKGVAIANYYERKKPTGFFVKAYAMAEFKGKGIFFQKHEQLAISSESQRIKPTSVRKR